MEDFLLQLYGVYEYDIDLEMNDIEINYIYNCMEKIKYYFNQIFNKSNEFKINKKINDKECLISFNIIQEYQEYYLCEKCSCVFMIEPLNEWFTKSKIHNCPHCSFYIDINKIYINK
jgi:hypothetical protein